MSIFVRPEVYEADNWLRFQLQMMREDLGFGVIMTNQQVMKPAYSPDDAIELLNAFRPGDWVIPTVTGEAKEEVMKYFSLKGNGSDERVQYAARKINKIFMRELRCEINYELNNDATETDEVEIPENQNLFFEWSVVPSEPMTKDELKKYFPTQYSLTNRVVCEPDHDDFVYEGPFVSLAMDDRFEDNGEDCAMDILAEDVTLVSKIMNRSAMQYVVNREVGARIDTQDYRVRRTKRALKKM